MCEILFEDESMLAVDKPAGVVVHPTYKNVAGTLLDELRAARPAASSFSVVGRLDRLTSGIVIVAKSAAAHAELQRAWPHAEKEYFAVVVGQVEPPTGEIDLPLGTDPSDRRRRIVRDDGAPSMTRYERVAIGGRGSLLRCWPITGRRHQIRVHLAARGWPIFGDAVYGAPVEGFPRHALHCRRISVATPTGGSVRIESPVPADLEIAAVPIQ